MASVSVGIVGTGWVGASVAISTLHSGVAQELLVYDARRDVAEGEAMDLAHGGAFYAPASVRNVEVEALRGTDALVIAAGRGGGPAETRLALLQGNAAILRTLAEQIKGYEGIVVVVTNPVDVLTHVFQQASGLPPERVVGTGTMLDTARLRHVLGRELRLDPRSVHAQVVGEHGDSEVVLWSSAQVGGLPLRSWPGWSAEREERLAAEVRTAAYEIIRRKGATNHAIGLATAALLKNILTGARRVLTVSRVQCGALGFSDVALSLPAVVDAGGARDIVAPQLAPDEQAALARSAEVLRRAMRSLGPPPA